MPEGVFRDAHVVFEVLTVTQYEFLAENGYLVDVGEIYDVALADACEDGGSLAEALAEDGLHLRQIHANRSFHPVAEHDVRIVAIRLEVDYLGYVYPEKLVARVEVKIPCLVHNAGKCCKIALDKTNVCDIVSLW